MVVKLMGLDNSIKIRNYEDLNIKYPFYVKTGSFNDELCYWRKCWTIRGEILSCLSLLKYYSGNDGEIKIAPEDIPNIINVLKKLNNKKSWEASDTIWDWNKYTRRNIRRCIRNLKWLNSYWKKHPELEVYFYDSY